MNIFSNKNKISIAIIIAAFIIGGFVYLFNIDAVEARSGCCSWHGGVCTYKCPDGVNVGYMCCDGTSLSAKCAPYYSSCPARPTPECPSHSTYNPSSGSCECSYGYIASRGECIDADTYCHNKYGLHSRYDTLLKDCECDYGYMLDSSNNCVTRDKYCQTLHSYHAHYDSLKKQCECDYGYELSSGKCVKEEPEDIQRPPIEQTPQQPVEEPHTQPAEEHQSQPDFESQSYQPKDEEQPIEEELQSQGEPQVSQEEPQIEDRESDLDKLRAQVGEGLPDEESAGAQSSKGGSIWWIIGMGVAGYLFYVIRKRKAQSK